MKWKPLALVAAVCVLAATPFALADEGNPSTCRSAAEHEGQARVLLRHAYSSKRWHHKHPLGEKTRAAVDADLACVDPATAQDVKGDQKKLKSDFFLYRHYRKIAPYKCLKGPKGYFAIPCYIIECESHFDWWAMNPSGASYIYQLLGWGAPPPNSWRNKVRNHEIAAGLGLSNWACA